MRTKFVEFCEARAAADPNFVLITADLGYGIFDRFRANCGSQFVNIGVAEQNLIGVATGDALTGGKPLCYSLANFPTFRCLEQIRNDAAYHEAQVTIVASGGGFAYGQLGMSHHATEDLGVLRCLPNVEIFAPATPTEAEMLMPYIFDRPSVKYVRLEKTGADAIHVNDHPLANGYFQYSDGADALILAVGGILEEALEARSMLLRDGIDATVVSLACFKSREPSHQQALTDLLLRFDRVLTMEEHNVVGGLGTVVTSALGKLQEPKHVVCLGMPDRYSEVVGDQKYLRAHYGLDAAAAHRSLATSV